MTAKTPSEPRVRPDEQVVPEERGSRAEDVERHSPNHPRRHAPAPDVPAGAGAIAEPTRMSGGKVRNWAVLGLTAILVTGAVAWGAWLISGGGLFWVGSPSMGMIAPVGSLVATQPLAPSARLHVGEIVVFDPHPGTSITYVHRIHLVLPHGHYLTKGDLNQVPDPWIISRGDIIGTPQAIIPAIGWLYKCATWLFLGAATLIFVSHFAKERQRRWILALGVPLLWAVPVLWYRPFIGGFLYGSGQRGRMVTANMVDTGILPVQYTPSIGRAVRAVPGQGVMVTGLTTKHKPVFDIRVSAALPWWGWALVILVCLSPLIGMVHHDRRVRSRSRTTEGTVALEPWSSSAEELPTAGARPLAPYFIET